MAFSLIDEAAGAIPIAALTKDQLPAWLEAASERERNWLTSIGFSADPGKFALVPSEIGRLARVLLGFDGADPGAKTWTLAGLPEALPEGCYRLESLPDGADPFVDKLYRLTRLGAIRAVSVGFIPLEMEDRFDDDDRWLGFRFLRSQLIELSLVSVPANPDAVQLAKSIDAHPAFLRRVFPDYQSDRPVAVPAASAREFSGNPRQRAALDQLARFKAAPGRQERF